MALPAPNSPVAICNLSLSQLNQDFVTNIETPPVGDDVAALCKKWFPEQRRATLRSHVWNFAIKRVQIAADATPPLFGFSTAYDLPPDYIRFLTRHDDIGTPLSGSFVEGVDYQIEDGQFLTQGSTTTGGVLNMRYIFDQEDILKWDALATDLLVVNLALKLAPKFKSSPRAIANLKDTIRELKAEAKAIDGQERPPRRVQRSKFLRARRNRSSTSAGRFTRFD